MMRHFQSQAIVDALPFQLSVLDSKGIIQSVNSAWTGFALENDGDEVTQKGIGLDYLKACRGDTTPKGKRIRKGIGDVLAGKATEFEVEYPCHSPNQKRWFLMKASALKPLGMGAVIAHFQITDRVLAEKALRDSRRRLILARDSAVDSERFKSEFLAQMSHEIRTPITGIFGLIGMLRDSLSPGDQISIVDEISTLTDHLLGIVNDVLDLAKAEAGNLTLEDQAFDPGKLISGICEMMAPAADAKGLSLSHSLSPDFPMRVSGDARRVRQILLNLVGNALKFTAQGSIRILAETRAEASGSILMMVSVQDTGAGISSENQKRLFRRFSQIDDNSGAAAMGTGLGLSISRQLALAMGGDINLSSEVGRGSEFKLTIKVRPIQPGDASSQDEVPKEKRSGSVDKQEFLPSKKILVAEDNALNQRIITLILKKLGWSVVLAKDGLEALSFLDQGGIAAVLLDCQMSGMNGYETAAAIRSREVRLGISRIPVFAITADILNQNLDRCLKSGMDGLLAKPFRNEDMSDFLSKVERFWSP